MGKAPVPGGATVDRMSATSGFPANRAEDDARIIKGLRDRDDEIIRELIGRVRAAAIKAWNVSFEEAEDIAAVTVTRAWLNLDSYQGRGAAFSWVMGIARHVRLDRQELAAREVARDPDQLVEETQEEWEDDLLQRIDLEEALDELAEDEQRVVELRLREQLSVAETSRKMGRSEDGVKSLQKRAKQKLGARLAGWGYSRQGTGREQR